MTLLADRGRQDRQCFGQNTGISGGSRRRAPVTWLDLGGYAEPGHAHREPLKQHTCPPPRTVLVGGMSDGLRGDLVND